MFEQNDGIFGTFCLSAKRSSRLNVGFKHLAKEGAIKDSILFPKGWFVSATFTGCPQTSIMSHDVAQDGSTSKAISPSWICRPKICNVTLQSQMSYKKFKVVCNIKVFDKDMCTVSIHLCFICNIDSKNTWNS